MTDWTEIEAARAKAHAKHGANSIEGMNARDPRWLSVLVEEVGEAAHELTYDATGDLRAELVDVLAVASAWLDSLDRDARRRDPFGRLICEQCGDEVAYCGHPTSVELALDAAEYEDAEPGGSGA